MSDQMQESTEINEHSEYQQLEESSLEKQNIESEQINNQLQQTSNDTQSEYQQSIQSVYQEDQQKEQLNQQQQNNQNQQSNQNNIEQDNQEQVNNEELNNNIHSNDFQQDKDLHNENDSQKIHNIDQQEQQEISSEKHQEVSQVSTSILNPNSIGQKGDQTSQKTNEQETSDKIISSITEQPEIILNQQQNVFEISAFERVEDKIHQTFDRPQSPEPEVIDQQIIQPTLIHEEEEKQIEQAIQKEEGEIIDETQEVNSKKSISQKQIPPPQPILPEIDIKEQKIIQFQKSLDEATFLKNQGNQLFQNKNYQKAIEQYNLASGLCDPYYLMQCPEELLNQFKKLRVILLSNLSACYLNLGEYNDCITHANVVIQLDDNNMKAWYRRAIAHQQKGQLEEAWRDIDKAWNLVKTSTQDSDIFEKRKEIREQLRQHNEDSKILYQNMMNSQIKKPTDSRLESSQILNNDQKSSIIPNSLNYGNIVIKTVVSALLASSMTKFVLEDSLNTKKGIIEAVVLGTTTAPILLFKKEWEKLTFATITAGVLAFILFKKQSK